MYNEYFGFKEAPFSIAPDPRYLYMTPQHREALAHLVYGLNSEGGCILLTGEVGTGKTTICRCLLEQIPDQANVALMLNPKVNEIELLESICDELHISYPDTNNSPKTYTDRIYKFLIESNRKNEKTVLIIDEAQNLDSKVLEQLRLLTNLETNQRKLLQIIILGQPELLTILAQTEMRQLAQRITARFHLEPLNKHELKAYISHRLAVAGQSIQLFPESSIKLIYKLSKGIPRLVNIICDRALLGAYVESQYSVNTNIVKKAATEVFGELKNVEKHQQNKRWLYPIAAISGVVILAVLIAFYFKSTGSFETLLPTANTGNTENSIDVIADPQTPDTEETETTIAANDITTDEDTGDTTTENMSAVTDGSSAEHAASDDSINNLPDAASGSDSADNTQALQTSDNTDTPTNSSGDHPVETADKNSQTDQTYSDQAYDDLSTIVMSAAADTDAAYQELFKTWKQNYDPEIKLTACKQAEKLSLSCLFRRGNINSLKLHNRPAVLTLIDAQGAKRYVTITAIKDDIATIYSNNKAYRIKLQELDKYWHGQYTLLWNKPEFYSTAISPGDSGDIIYWLKEQLEKINNTSAPNIVISKYDDYLVEKIRAFQSQQGLETDGIVGPITIIHLNNELGIQTPLLTSPPIQTVINQG